MPHLLRLRILGLIFLLPALATTALAQPVVGVLGIATEVAPIEKRLEDSREIAVRG